MSWPSSLKVVNNSDAGDADHVGGDDWDTLAAAVNAHSVYESYDYFVFKSGSTYYAKNGTTGKIDLSNSDFRTVLQGVIDAISPAGTPTMIKIGSGDFTLHNQILINASDVGNITIEGSGIGRTNLLVGSGFNSLSGTSVILIGSAPSLVAGNIGTLTSNKSVGTVQVVMSAPDVAKFVAGDYALLRSTALWCDPAVANSLSKKGEIHRVTLISGTNVYMDSPGFDSYLTADTATLVNLTGSMTKNVTLRNFSIKKDSGFTGNANVFLFCQLCDNLLLDGIEVMDGTTQFDNAITLRSCINSKIINCRLVQNPSITYNDQYGIVIRACCQNIVVNNCQSFGRFRHPFEYATGTSSSGFEGPPRHIVFSNCQSWDSEVGAFSAHGDGEFITVANCMASGMQGGYGFYSRTKNVKFVNCTVNSTNNHGFYLTQNAHGNEVINCNISNITTSNTYGVFIDEDIKNTSVRGNKFYNCQDQCILIADGAQDVTIADNIFDSCSGDNTSSEGVIETTGYSNDVIITGNNFTAGTIPGSSLPVKIHSSGVDNLIFEGNNCTGMATTTPSIPTASGFVRVVNNLGTNPINKITNHTDSTNFVIAFYGGDTGSVVASTDYLIEGGPILMTSTGGTDVSITITDNGGNTVASGLTTLTAQFLPSQFKINFGGFSVAPTVTVFGT